MDSNPIKMTTANIVPLTYLQNDATTTQTAAANPYAKAVVKDRVADITGMLPGKETAIETAITGIVTKRQNMATISQAGKAINETFRLAQATGDKNVIEGVKVAAKKLAEGGNETQAAKFFNNINEIGKIDVNAFKETLSIVDDMEKKGIGNYFNTYVNNVNSTFSNFGTEKVNNLNASINAITGASYENQKSTVQGNLTGFFNEYGKVIASNPNNVNIGNQLDTLTTDVKNKKTGDSVALSLYDFRQKFKG